MIPIKEAINIFEQCKIDWLRGFIPEEPQFGIERQVLGNFIDKNKIMGKPLLFYTKKRYIKNTILGKLQLYGKNYKLSMEGKSYNELEYIKVYLTAVKEENDLLELRVLKYPDIYDSNELFENYNYVSMYNPSTNYTVIGDRRIHYIEYMDISVDNNEFGDFLNNLFTKEEKING